MLYGILKSITNTGIDSELQNIFSTPLAIYSNQPSNVQDMINLRRKGSSQNVQRWEIEANLVQSNSSADFFVHSLVNGHWKKFYIRMPQVYGIPTTNANITVNSSINAGGDAFNILGAAKLNFGEFLQFVGDSKVYIVTNPGSAGVGVVVFPVVKAGVALGTVIKTGGAVTMLATYDTSVQLGIKYVDGILSDPGSVKFIEAI